MTKQVIQSADAGKQPDRFFSVDLKQKLFLLVVGFLFTGVVGAFLSFYFQSKSAYNNSKAGLIESERKIAKEIFEDAAKSMDGRAYCAQIVNDNYALHPGKKVSDEKWNAYVKEMDDWNRNINRRGKLFKLYFNVENNNRLRKIHSEFLALNRVINVSKNGADSTAYKNAKAKIDALNTDIAVITYWMIDQIQKDSIGRVPGLKKFSFADYFK